MDEIIGLAMKEYDKQMKVNEQLSIFVHEYWSNWMRHLFSKCIEVGDGNYEIPAHLVKRWKRQMETQYQDLPEDEKKSDREIAFMIMKIFLGDD